MRAVRLRGNRWGQIPVADSLSSSFALLPRPWPKIRARVAAGSFSLRLGCGIAGAVARCACPSPTFCAVLLGASAVRRSGEPLKHAASLYQCVFRDRPYTHYSLRLMFALASAGAPSFVLCARSRPRSAASCLWRGNDQGDFERYFAHLLRERASTLGL